MEEGSGRRTAPGEADESFGEIVDRAGRRVTTGLVIAGALVGAGLYWRPAPPRYDAFAVGERVVRVDTKTGTIIACDGARCAYVHRRGQDVARRPNVPLLPAAPSAAPAPPTPARAPASER